MKTEGKHCIVGIGSIGPTLELWQENVDDLILLDGQGKEVDLLDGFNLAVFYEAAELQTGHSN